ncbi:MAG: ABC transporter ATP-binding protein [Rikenellaceae bacterium]|jgi:zinc transport system ATP-binding protein|nr:ABC transporter ATP-binding protein [Rikenellaceae bacterium]
MKEVLVSLRNVTVGYDGNIILPGVDLDIYSDDFLGVIGPNGGGKTTLVRAILGTLPYSGTIEYADTLTINKIRRIGYLPQQNLFDRSFPISVIEVVVSGLQGEKRLGSRYRKADFDKARKLLEMTGIADLEKRPVGEISGGQMQRALLCRALIAEPRLLILDEPTTYVDNRFEGELYEILHRLNDRMAIVMVSHDVGTITSVVRSIVCVNRGVHRHDSNLITAEQLENYGCPIQVISHGPVPHTVLGRH